MIPKYYSRVYLANSISSFIFAKLGCSPVNVDALFTAQQPVTQIISRISYRTVHESWRKLISIYPDLVGIKIHDLRHTFATERVGLMGIEELRALMGHENIQTTLRYQRMTSGRAEEVARQALNSLTLNKGE